MSPEDWTEKVFSVSVALDHEVIGNLTFPVCGGADRGEFLQIGSIYQSEIEYSTGFNEDKRWVSGPPPARCLQEGDIILETDGWSAVGLRKREYLGLTNRIRYFVVCLKCVRPEHFPVSLRDYLDVDYSPGDANYDLQNQIRENLLKVSPPVTTRFQREDEIDGVDYSFVTMECLFQMEKDGRLLQFKEYDGYYYGIQKPNLNTQVATKAIIEEFQARPLIKRSESFMKAFDISLDDSLEKLSERNDLGNPSSPQSRIIHRKITLFEDNSFRTV